MVYWNTILEKLNLIKEGKITKAGILLFSKNPQKFYIQAKIKIGRFKNLMMKHEHPSKLRNPLLANVFFYADKYLHRREFKENGIE